MELTQAQKKYILKKYKELKNDEQLEALNGLAIRQRVVENKYQNKAGR